MTKKISMVYTLEYQEINEFHGITEINANDIKSLSTAMFDSFTDTVDSDKKIITFIEKTADSREFILNAH